MKKVLIVIVGLFWYVHTSAQPKPFEKGFDEGFKKGYCYNKSPFCNCPITPLTPLPRVNENENSFEDGYNRGFQVGLDLQRVDGSMTSTLSLQTIKQYRFNDYIPQLPVNDYVNVLAYKKALFDSRLQWIQNRVNDIHDLNYQLLFQHDNAAYISIKNSITEWGNRRNKNGIGDLADRKIFNIYVQFLSEKENEIYTAYSKSVAEANTLERYYQILRSASELIQKNPKVALIKISEAEQLQVKDDQALNLYLKWQANFALENYLKTIEIIDDFLQKCDNATRRNEALLIKISSYVFLKNYSFAQFLLDDAFGKNDAKIGVLNGDKELEAQVYLNKIFIFQGLGLCTDLIKYCDKLFGLELPDIGLADEQISYIKKQKEICLEK